MNEPRPVQSSRSVRSAVRIIRNAVVAYALIGLGYGLREFLYQASRFDSGFDPMFTGVLVAAIWPIHFYHLLVTTFRR